MARMKFWPSSEYQNTDCKEIGQSHIVKATWTVKGLLSQNLYASKFLHLEKHYVIHARFLLDF